MIPTGWALSGTAGSPMVTSGAGPTHERVPALGPYQGPPGAESATDTILEHLDKGHTVADASKAVVLLREHGIEVRPSRLPFTPWTTINDLVDLLYFVVAHDLVPRPLRRSPGTTTPGCARHR